MLLFYKEFGGAGSIMVLHNQNFFTPQKDEFPIFGEE